MAPKSYLCASSFWISLLFAACLLIASGVRADTLDDILSRKKIVIGVSRDEGALSQVDKATGTIKGFEPDLARDLARSLGVDLELVPLSLSERENAIIDRKIDVLIASFIDNKVRRSTMVPIIPHYYHSGVSLLSRKVENIKKWEDLRNRRICVEYGAFYNRPVMVRFGVDIIPLHDSALALAALLDGRCIGILYLESTVNSKLQASKWSQDFIVPLEKLSTPPWSVYLNIKEKNSRLEKWITDTVIRWHRDGLILDLEKKWGFPDSPFTIKMNMIWNKKNNNEYFCTTPINNQTPSECIK
jgi:polar amino acid transport system substrate-binding protein